LFITTASSSSDNRLYLDNEAILNDKPNSRITRVDKDDYQNKSGFTFLAFCNNDRRELNKEAVIVCLYNNAWHRVCYDSKRRAYLGAPQPNVHYYNEDLKLPTESNVDSEEEEPTKKRKSDPVTAHIEWGDCIDGN
jgi:hypothetical protein